MDLIDSSLVCPVEEVERKLLVCVLAIDDIDYHGNDSRVLNRLFAEHYRLLVELDDMRLDFYPIDSIA